MLWPLWPVPLFFFISHKAFRLLAQPAMLAAFFSSLAIAGSPVYAGALCVQSIFYLLAICGALLRLRPAILMLPFYFSLSNAAVFPGFYHAAMRRRGMAWD